MRIKRHPEFFFLIKHFIYHEKIITFARSKIQTLLNFRGVAQLAARHVRDVEVGSSSLLTPT